MRRIILAVLSCLMLAGCSGPMQLIDTAVDGPKLRASDPAPVHLADIEFFIVSKENLDEYLPRLESGELVIVGMEPDDYKNLSINTKKLQNYIKSQREVIAAYREFYENE